METVYAILFFIIASILGLWVFVKLATYHSRETNRLNKETEEKTKADIEKWKKFLEEAGSLIPNAQYLGLYQVGLETAKVRESVWGIVSKDDFIFVNSHMSTLANIPRNSVNSITLEDKTRVSQRLSAAGIALFGVFALARPKNVVHEAYCLTFDWQNSSGAKQFTVFYLDGNSALEWANEAVNVLQKYIEKPQKISGDQRVCPYCAEVIKSEARLCRYCRSTLIAV